VLRMKNFISSAIKILGTVGVIGFLLLLSIGVLEVRYARFDQNGPIPLPLSNCTQAIPSNVTQSAPHTDVVWKDSTELFDIFNKKKGRIVWKWLNYFPIYEENFMRFKNKNISMIEIGTRDGGSLDMWRSYFGLGMRMIGIDINPNAIIFNDTNNMFIGSQNDSIFLQRVVDTLGKGTVSVILDDASHHRLFQATSYSVLSQLLAPDSVYMIEDVELDSLESYRQFKAFFHVSHLFTNNVGASPKMYSFNFYKMVMAFNFRPLSFQGEVKAIKKGTDAITCGYPACR